MAVTKKGTTDSRRRHKFISFRERVSGIKIDPLRRTKRRDDIGDKRTESYFRVALLKWKELNTSRCFVNFAQEVTPISQSLPQVLYHKVQIFAILNKAIAEKEKFACQPLLDLLAQFAHDIGPEFEEFLPSAIGTLISVSFHEDIEVVEWTFNCMAYLFKYLFRYLVDKLGATFDLISPLLSQHERKPHLSRFAAESFSFFLRNSKQASVDFFCDHAFQELATSTSATFEGAICVLFAEALKGPDNTINSKAPRLILKLQDYCATDSDDRKFHVFLTILADVLHHANKSTLAPLYEIIFKWITKQLSQDSVSEEFAIFIAKELLLLVGLRKGTRVPDWDAALDVYRRILATVNKFPKSAIKSKAVWELCKLSQALLQHAENMDDALATTIVETIYNIDDSQCFLPFCDLFTELIHGGSYTAVVWLWLQRFIDRLDKIDDYTVLAILAILRKWKQSKEIPAYISPIRGSSSLAKLILAGMQNHASIVRAGNIGAYSSLGPKLELLHNICEVSSETMDYLVGLVNVLRASKINDSATSIIYGRALSLLAKGLRSGQDISRLVLVFKENSEQFENFGSNKYFVHGLMEVLNVYKLFSHSVPDDKEFGLILKSLMAKLEINMRDEDPELRLGSLKLMCLIYELQGDVVPDILNLCLSIDETSFEISTARTLSMHIRRIAIEFPLLKDEQLRLNIISYCFALLKSQFQPVWQEAIATLVKLASSNRDAVWKLLYSGIAMSSGSSLQHMETEFSKPGASYDNYDFHCTNVQQIETKSGNAIQKMTHVDTLLNEYYSNDAFTSKVDKDTIRRRCYAVLNNLSRLAEQRSSELVPLFLYCEDGGVQKKTVLLDILKLFSSFENPSSSLNGDIYSRIMRLLASPDSGIQKLALDCILAWGDASVTIYKGNLQNLLNPQVFKDELTNLLLGNADARIITREHADNVMPLIVHILYGLAVGHHSKNNNGNDKGSHRSTIISAVGNLPPEYVLLFIKLSSEAIPNQILLDIESGTFALPDYEQLEISQSQLRKITGFMNMATDILHVLKGSVGSSGDWLLESILSCVVYAQWITTRPEVSTEILKLVRLIRSTGMKCLEVMLADVSTINWARYKIVLIQEIILPRMEHFKDENTQDISPIMRIFLIWSSAEYLLSLLDYDENIVPQIMETMDFQAAKDPIYLAAIQFVANLLEFLQSSADDDTKKTARAISERTLPLFLPRLARTLSSKRNPEIVQSGIAVLRQVVNIFGEILLKDSLLLEHYVDICLSVVQSSGSHAHHINDVFEVLDSLVRVISNNILLRNCYDALSPLLQSVKERHTRTSLVKIFSSLNLNDDIIKAVADLLVDLNSYSKVKLDEVDYERRLSAYATFNVDLWSTCTPLQWCPILHDSIYWITASDERAIQGGASSVLKRFIEITSSKATAQCPDRVQFFALLESVIIPALRKGLQSENAMLRYEYVGILKALVQFPAAYPKVANLHVLLFDGDEEADFFNNIIHVQSHRRQRAIYRLGQIALSDDLGDFNIAHLLLPLLEHFLRDSTTATLSIAEEAIGTIGKLCLSLSWNHYHAIVQRYLSDLEKREKVRFFSRLLDSVSEAIYHRSSLTEEEPKFKKYNAKKSEAFMATVVVPKLRKIIKLSDENSLADRVTLAVPLTKFLCGTSEEMLVSNLTNVTLELSQHLKNRLQDVRDAVRKVFAKICVIVGPRHLGLICRQIQSVLKRGSQKHILSFTVHSLLVTLIGRPRSQQGDLDSSLDIIADICMDDIFGVTGSEKDADEYISKMREVKENKSYDSMEILSANVSVGRFNDLLHPVRRVLSDARVDFKIERKINDLLRRIGTGISQNAEGSTREAILFSLALCSENTGDWKPDTSLRAERGGSKKAKLTLTKKVQVGKNLADNIHFLQRFGLDVIKNCLRKNRELIGAFELQEFVKSLKPYLSSQYEDIQLSSLQLLSTAAKYSSLLEELDSRFLFTYVVGVVQNAPSVTTYLSQTGLKLLSILLQKKKYSAVDESSIAYIVQKLQLDFIEPDKQSHSFAFIKAVLLQKIVIPEVYDVMDKIREIMVNSGSKNTREVCKSLFCQFLMDYPQGRGRLNKQMRFLVHNLNYEHATGRESVMEVLFVLLSKSKNDVVQSIIELFFVPLTMTLVNDESMECKEMALLLFRTIVQMADEENSRLIMKSCLEWTSQKDSPELKEAASQILEILKEFGKGGI
ncbi:armadillo-type protein [Lipomyces kononenkoae]|uniref:Armadillo-type protein n=1 Tax=Lipomyces kononenkoae TaxID=34357 RepID=A0ACC3TC38_LIPKO